MVLLSFTVLTVDAKLPFFSTIRSGAADVLAPVGRFFGDVTKPVRSWWGGATDYDKVVEENQKLRAEVERLRAKQARNVDADAELAKLQEQLGLPFIGDIPTIVAQISTGPYSSFDDNTLRINRGAKDGIKTGMPVVGAGGLVGKILSTSTNESVIRLITDQDFKVGVKLASSGNYAIGHGEGPGHPFLVDEKVELDQEVLKGESVLTSGLETSAFPQNIPVGTVTKVLRSPARAEQMLEVELTADLTRLSVVSVMVWEPKE
jgi:rod shape-determining protein MreC